MKKHVFVSYSSVDEQSRMELEKHLSLLKREEAIETWNFRLIDAGTDWKSEIDAHLESADIIVLLVSADFIASDYCWNIEMREAIRRHRDGTARVIPVIVRDCDWSSAPFAAIQALPPGGRPVTSHRPKDKAWKEVADGIRKAISQPKKGLTESPPATPETAVQRAQRLESDSRARRAHDEKWQSQARSAFYEEMKNVFRELDSQSLQISQATEIKMRSGWKNTSCVVRLEPIGNCNLTLFLYRSGNGQGHDELHLTAKLLLGAMVLPGEAGVYLDEPKIHTTKRWIFRLSPAGQWTWRASSFGAELCSVDLASNLLESLLQLQEDIETGKVKLPDFW